MPVEIGEQDLQNDTTAIGHQIYRIKNVGGIDLNLASIRFVGGVC